MDTGTDTATAAYNNTTPLEEANTAPLEEANTTPLKEANTTPLKEANTTTARQPLDNRLTTTWGLLTVKGTVWIQGE